MSAYPNARPEAFCDAVFAIAVSVTMYLSFVDLPVSLPVSHVNAPLSASISCFAEMVFSINSLAERFQYIFYDCLLCRHSPGYFASTLSCLYINDCSTKRASS